MSAPQHLREQKDFYDDYWGRLQPISDYKAQRTKWIMEALLTIRKEMERGHIQLLDLGCGDGRLTSLWNSLTGGITYGLELSSRAVERAAKMFPSVRYLEGDATRTPYRNDMFDIIVCQEVLEHVEDQRQLVRECRRILRSNGYLILTTPNKFYFDRRLGGNYSHQPIERLVDKQQLLSLLEPSFAVHSLETVIYARGSLGIYRAVTNRYWLALLRRFGLVEWWKRRLLKDGYGLHLAVVCRKA